MQAASLYFLHIEFVFISKILASFQSILWLYSNEFCCNLDLSRRPSSKFFACYLGLIAHGLPISSLRIFWFCIVPVVYQSKLMAAFMISIFGVLQALIF